VASQLQEPFPPEFWIFDTGAGRGVRLTRDNVPQIAPVFSSDGRRIFFAAFSRGPWGLWELPLQGGEGGRALVLSPSAKTPNDVSPDGRHLLYRDFDAKTRGDLKVLPLDGEPRPQVYLATADDESNGDFSPDGRWVAYVSDESGRQEVYAASFPEPARRIRVSSEGGTQPRWSRDGKELFYVRSGELMAAGVESRREELVFGESQPLFSLSLFTQTDSGFDHITRYDVAPDGRFLALLRAGEETPTPLVLVQNWAATLEKD
jgi:Tol biopolymer transport system component